jgi:nitroreductase
MLTYSISTLIFYQRSGENGNRVKKTKEDGIMDRVEENRVLDGVIAGRRSVRAFKPEAPPDVLIEQIVAAGLAAPYAGLASKEDLPYRLFRIVRQGPSMARARELIREQAKASLEQFKAEMEKNAYLRENGAAFAKRVEGMAASGVPSLESAPFFVVVAERRGVPPVEFESLAHCLENMWLKATALGLGFQLLSMTKMMSENRRFFELLDLEFGKFLINGCVIGYAKHAPGEKRLFPLADVMKWV